MSMETPSKQDVVLVLLEQANSILVHLDPRIQGVMLPPNYKRQSHLVLQYGLNMPIPIHDLQIDDQGIAATLSFNRSPTWTFVPWAAIFAVIDGEQQRGYQWDTDMPYDLKSPQRPRIVSATNPPLSAVPKKESKRPVLRAIRGGNADPELPEPTRTKESKPATRSSVKPTLVALVNNESTSSTTTEPPREIAPVPSVSSVSTNEELIEPPSKPQKPKRELPPYLRIVK